jgi:tetratricopeptide (TPR) repeat protein
LMSEIKPKLALVLGVVPAVDDVDQLQLLSARYDVSVLAAESIVGFLSQMSFFQGLTCVALPDYDENPSYLPGLEQALAGFQLVIVKERLGLYAYQCVKAKWRHKFRLLVWIDNLTAFPAQDARNLQVICSEVTAAADGFLVQSRAAATVLEIEGISEDRVLMMTPWVARHSQRTGRNRAAARQELGIAESDFLVGYFGQIEWEESLTDLVAAIKIAAQKAVHLRRKLRVVFCGIGSFASELREAFIRLGIDDYAVYVKPDRRSVEAINLAVDAIFYSPVPSRDRSDGDPYRLLNAMVHEIPIIAPRAPMVEELCGKHRIDFCLGSPHSLANGIIKLESAQHLGLDIVRKNIQTVTKRFSKDQVSQEMLAAFAAFSGTSLRSDDSNIDQLMVDVENRITNKQYLDAIEIIEGIFQRPAIPTHHRANLYRLIGDCFAKLGDNEAAKNAYVEAAELDPYSAKVYIGLGTLGLVKNSCDIAVLHFQKAVSLAPEDEMANLGLGLAFHGMEERQEARRWVLKALGINFQNTAAIFTLVKLGHELGEYAEVEVSLHRYLGVHPNDYNMIYTLAGVYFKMGRYEQALKLAEEMASVDPMDQKAHALAQQARLAMNEAQVTGTSHK